MYSSGRVLSMQITTAITIVYFTMPSLLLEQTAERRLFVGRAGININTHATNASRYRQTLPGEGYPCQPVQLIRSKQTPSRGLRHAGTTTRSFFDNAERSTAVPTAATRRRFCFSPSAARVYFITSNSELLRSFRRTLQAWHGLSVLALLYFTFVQALCMGESRSAVNRPIFTKACPGEHTYEHNNAGWFGNTRHNLKGGGGGRLIDKRTR